MLAAIGRPLPGGAATQSVNIVLPGEVYGPRINTVDFRFAKVLRFGAHADQRRARPLQPVQRNTGTAFNQGFGDGSTWLRPTTIMSPRFVRFNVTFDF